MKYIVAILIFTLIIMFHELGHFLLARKNGIVVEEFCLGFGPDVIHKKIGDTKYSIKLFWLGGACMMKGEDENSDGDEEGSFQSASVWGRMAVVLAGPFFNFILAFVLAIVLISMIGIDVPVVAGLSENTQAVTSGLQEGDRIVQINDKKIHVRREATLYLYFHPSALKEDITLVYERDGVKYTTAFPVTYVEREDGSSGYMMGISFLNGRVKANPLQVIQYSFYEVEYWINTTVSSLKMLILGKVSSSELSGPVGIVKTIGDTYTTAQTNGGTFLVIANMLNISILLTANLGVMNLLPLPALDGGRFLFLLVEAIRRKKVDQEKEGFVHMIGFALLLTLMVFVMFNDLKNIFIG